VELAQNAKRPERMVVTLQLEVARRLMATVASEDYGLLTLLVQLRYEPGELFKIPRGCFFPEPDVDSAGVVLARRRKELLPQGEQAAFERIVRRALSQRRKMMVKLLKADWPAEKVQEAIAALGLRSDVRGEKLTLEQFVALTKILAAS
jgi:16S rRNA (adenine1518-N6/adenine1519-N6)-dimethyltransferase